MKCGQFGIRQLPVGGQQADRIEIKKLIDKLGPREFKRIVRLVMNNNQAKEIAK